MSKEDATAYDSLKGKDTFEFFNLLISFNKKK